MLDSIKALSCETGISSSFSVDEIPLMLFIHFHCLNYNKDSQTLIESFFFFFSFRMKKFDEFNYLYFHLI